MAVASEPPHHSQVHHQSHQQHLHPGHAYHSMSQHPEQDVHGLRLALGSILSPKRLSPSSSSRHSSSGTASPAHFGPGLVHPYQPSHLHDEVSSSSPPNRPQSALSRSTSFPDAHASGSQTPAIVSSVSHTPPHPSSHSPHHEHEHPAPAILTTSNVQGLSPAQEAQVRENVNVTGGAESAEAAAALKKRGMAAYIETLKSKRAWDALVHGNMS